MANRILSVLFKKKYKSGDTDTIYMRNRAKDVYTGEAGSATMDTIVTKVNGMAAGATKVAGSSSNGYISINGTSTKVYTHPNSGATAGTYNQVTVNAQGHVTAGSNVTTWTGSVSGSVANATSTFTRASSRANLTSGEKISVSLGKISKWFADLKSMAFVDKVGVSNLDSTLTTQYNKRVTTDDVTQSTSITEAGWVADARVIRTLQNQINTLNSNVQNVRRIKNSGITMGDTFHEFLTDYNSEGNDPLTSIDFRAVQYVDDDIDESNYFNPPNGRRDDNWYNTITFNARNDRLIQLAFDIFDHGEVFFTRVQHDNTTYNWKSFYSDSKFGEIATINGEAITNKYLPGLYRCNNCGVLGLQDSGFWGYCLLFNSDVSGNAERYWVVFQNQALSKIHFICNYNGNQFITKTISIDDIAYNSLINPQIAGKAPKSHASTSTEYGAATSGAYGHVKIADTYTSSLGHDTALSSAGAYAMYNEYHNNIDDSRWFRRFSTAKNQDSVTIRSVGKQAGNWPLMIGVGEMVIMFNCMTSGLTSSLSTTRNCWKALVQPDTQIISSVQAMIEGNDHILVRVFLSSEWNNGYSGFVRSMDRQYEIGSVGTA